MKNHALRFARTFAKALGCLVFCVAALGASPALAATAITCTVGPYVPADVSCSGSGFTPYADIFLSLQPSPMCGTPLVDTGVDADANGDFITASLGSIVEANDFWFIVVGEYEMSCEGIAWDLGSPRLVNWETCGDSTVDAPPEECDDGGVVGGDGCYVTCNVESGWTCEGSPSVCTEDVVCGDGVIESPEACDDSNATSGDGCSDACVVESGWVCSGEPSSCTEEAAPAAEGDVESTVHKVVVASAPFVCLAAFFAACWGWPLKRRK